MFHGEYEHAVDVKGRVAIPAQFRRELAGDAVISVGPEGRLVIWPTAEAWNVHHASIRLTAGSPADQRRLESFTQARTGDVELDSQGRLLLGAVHRNFAGIRERATFIGMEDHIEVLATERWQEYTADLTPEFFTELYDRVNSTGAAAPGSAPR